MADLPTLSERKAYYRACLLALRFVEARRPTNRRFGADADARWKAFQGDLTTADRIDLLIRDANAELPGAFGARTVFDFRAVAEDEPFGPGWRSLDPVDAESLWRAVLADDVPASLALAFDAVAQAWELALDRPALPYVEPADRLVLVGPGAIARAAELFDDAGTSLDWVAQTTCVATPPAHRQLAALAGAFLRITKPARIVAGGAPIPDEAKGSLGRASSDADPRDTAAAHEIPEVSWS